MPKTVTMSYDDFLKRLRTAQAEIEAVLSPRVTLDRDAVLAMVVGAIDAITKLRAPQNP